MMKEQMKLIAIVLIKKFLLLLLSIVNLVAGYYCFLRNTQISIKILIFACFLF